MLAKGSSVSFDSLLQDSEVAKDAPIFSGFFFFLNPATFLAEVISNQSLVRQPDLRAMLCLEKVTFILKSL